MKILHILKKNFKLLLRSKMTALVVVIAPLLIIILAGVAFNNNAAESDFSLGIYLKENTSLAQTFITQLENNSFRISYYETETQCTQAVKETITQACIVFPEGFDVTETTSELVVYADYSRRNFVFYLMDSISQSLRTKTSELSLDLTTNILNALDKAKQTNTEVAADLVKLKADFDRMSSSTDEIKNGLNNLNVESENVSITGVASELDDLKSDIKRVKDEGLDGIELAVEIAEAVLDEYDSTDFTNETSDLLDEGEDLNESDLLDEYNSTIGKVDELISGIDAASESVKKIEQKLSNVKSFKSSGSTKLSSLKTDLEKAKEAAESMKTKLEAVNQNIDTINVRKAEAIVEPIKTVVEPIVTETNNINYMFPYLVLLIIMFVSILLSSTMIIMEKKSKAYFRNFTTPTSDFTFTIATYITNFITILLQMSVLFVLAKFLLDIPVLNNAGLTILLLVIAITLFTALGMGIGYWFSSQEAVIMLSMSIASLFLLVSNLILPLEVMPPTIQMLASYNPYVMLSELLRQIVIFNIVPSIALSHMIVLATAAAVIFLLIIFVQKMNKFAYFKKLPHTKKQKEGKNNKNQKHSQAFKLYEKSIENEFDLLKELKTMDNQTFTTYVNKDKNDFYNWAKYVLKDKKLANRLKVKTRDEMIKALERK